MDNAVNISVVIPTYRRGAVLLDTLDQLLRLPVLPIEILVVDQTDRHPPDVSDRIQSLEHDIVRWISLSKPSIPHAMNIGLMEAKGKIVLFLDDDVVPSDDLIPKHVSHYDGTVSAVCGQVLQPGQSPEKTEHGSSGWSGIRKDLDVYFNSVDSFDTENVIACNLSVDRKVALSVGGFDEQFIGSAYRFETDFSKRLVSAGYRVVFAPDASVDHLRLSGGGTRSAGNHLRQPSPMHSVGDYYFVRKHSRGREMVFYMAHRLFHETVNRYYLKHPWILPKKIWSEFLGLIMASRLFQEGPKLISQSEGKGSYE